MLSSHCQDALSQQPAWGPGPLKKRPHHRQASFRGGSRRIMLSPQCSSPGKGQPGSRATQGVCRGPGCHSIVATSLCRILLPGLPSTRWSPIHSLRNIWPGGHRAQACAPSVTEGFPLPERPSPLVDGAGHSLLLSPGSWVGLSEGLTHRPAVWSTPIRVLSLPSA